MTDSHYAACVLIAAFSTVVFTGCVSQLRDVSATVADAGFHSGGVTQDELAAYARKARRQFSLSQHAGSKRDLSRPIRYWIHSPEPTEILVFVPVAPRRIDAYAIFHFDANTGRLKNGSMTEEISTIGKL